MARRLIAAIPPDDLRAMHKLLFSRSLKVAVAAILMWQPWPGTR
jgi:hypothetical protein